jgi:hypothetical protein
MKYTFKFLVARLFVPITEQQTIERPSVTAEPRKAGWPLTGC